MLSKEQLAEEQRKEAEYNKLFEKIISKSPFGQWYGLMIGASNLLTKNLPKRVGIDQDGRPLVVYKGDIGKLMGVWAVPTHKVIAHDLAIKDYKGALGAFFGSGQIVETIKQKKAMFFDISPEEVGEINKKKAEETKQKSSATTTYSTNVPVRTKKKNYVPAVVLSLLAITATIIGIVVYNKKGIS